jgi:hypothetical protein
LEETSVVSSTASVGVIPSMDAGPEITGSIEPEKAPETLGAGSAGAIPGAVVMKSLIASLTFSFDQKVSGLLAAWAAIVIGFEMGVVRANRREDPQKTIPVRKKYAILGSY